MIIMIHLVLFFEFFLIPKISSSGTGTNTGGQIDLKNWAFFVINLSMWEIKSTIIRKSVSWELRPRRRLTVRGCASKSAHPHFCLKIYALPCYSTVDWLIGYTWFALFPLLFFYKNILGDAIAFVLYASLITTPIGRLELVEFSRFVFGKCRFLMCADLEAKTRWCVDFKACSLVYKKSTRISKLRRLIVDRKSVISVLGKRLTKKFRQPSFVKWRLPASFFLRLK